ncbi:hypothetical protein PNH50_19135 (plasmid) [Leisingera aquaemixtae]|uniref:hypothetical protein n=1 Tax=Leisingera aquaemixtae TaxID=1396826 RepID=UPI00398425D0
MTDKDHYITDEALRIMERFPEVYGRPPWSVKKTSLAWGFSCGDGWYPLIARLSADLAAIVREDGLTRFRAQQVKQKLGGLRFYARGGNDRTTGRIAQAQMEAARTCEHCGTQPAEKRSLGGWLTTTCDACADRLLTPRT